jgi:uncharacterized protein with PQ loop repeat
VVVAMLAWCGAALSCLLCIPQAVRTLGAKRLDGVSASTYWIVLVNAAVWAGWSLLTGEHAAGAPALVNGPAAVVILRRLAAARRRRGAGRSYSAGTTTRRLGEQVSYTKRLPPRRRVPGDASAEASRSRLGRLVHWR